MVHGVQSNDIHPLAHCQCFSLLVMFVSKIVRVKEFDMVRCNCVRHQFNVFNDDILPNGCCKNSLNEVMACLV